MYSVHQSYLLMRSHIYCYCILGLLRAVASLSYKKTKTYVLHSYTITTCNFTHSDLPLTALEAYIQIQQPLPAYHSADHLTFISRHKLHCAFFRRRLWLVFIIDSCSVSRMARFHYPVAYETSCPTYSTIGIKRIAYPMIFLICSSPAFSSSPLPFISFLDECSGLGYWYLQYPEGL